MKIALPALLFCLLAVVLTQPVASQTAPGCGDPKIKFDVASARSWHPLPKPEAGKALVYFLQDDSEFNSHPRPTTRFGIDGNWVGATQSNAYFYISVDPGEHHICAGWQSFVGFTTGHTSGAAHFTAAAGNSYFFIVRDRYIENHAPAGMRLDPLDSDEGQLLAGKFALSASHAKK